MKAHTSDFKNQIKTTGRELDSKITYSLNGVNVELGKEQLNSITPTYQGALLKSVMKELDIDSAWSKFTNIYSKLSSKYSNIYKEYQKYKMLTSH